MGDVVAVEDEDNGRYHELWTEIIAQYCFDGRHESRSQRQTTSLRHGERP